MGLDGSYHGQRSLPWVFYATPFHLYPSLNGSMGFLPHGSNWKVAKSHMRISARWWMWVDILVRGIWGSQHGEEEAVETRVKFTFLATSTISTTAISTAYVAVMYGVTTQPRTTCQRIFWGKAGKKCQKCTTHDILATTAIKQLCQTLDAQWLKKETGPAFSWNLKQFQWYRFYNNVA